jgi:putative phosphoesterase
MENKLDQMVNIPHDHIICAGDVFHKWNTSVSTIQRFLRIPHIISIFGNHDLRFDDMMSSSDTGLGLIMEMNTKLKEYTIFPNRKASIILDEVKIHIEHVMIWHKEPPYPGCTASNAEDYMDKIDADIIVTGDNHKTFVVERNGKILFNPGSLLRSTSIQKDHKPCVFVYDTKRKSYEVHYLKIEEDVFLEDKTYEFLFSSFVNSINSVEWDVEIDFENNLLMLIGMDNVKKSVADKIRSMLKQAKEGK